MNRDPDCTLDALGLGERRRRGSALAGSLWVHARKDKEKTACACNDEDEKEKKPNNRIVR